MTLNVKENKSLRLIIISSAPVIIIIIAAWMAGAIFLTFNGYSASESSPLTIYRYWIAYRHDDQAIIWLSGAIAASLFICSIPFVIIIKGKPETLYGARKWASNRELKEAGLYSDDGIILGVRKNIFNPDGQYLILPGDTSVGLAAPTRSGKSVSVAVPNLLSWRGSVVVLDIKRELWDISSGYRAAHGQECFHLNFAPRDLCTHRWNPLGYITNNIHHRINDIQKIGTMIWPRIESEAPIWQASARSLWLGIILYLIETDGLPVTLGEALRQVTMGDARLIQIVEERQESNVPLSPECYLSLKEYFDTPDRTRGSIRKGFTSALELFMNPVIDAATATNDFDIRQLREKPMSIYLCVSPDDLDRLEPLINLFFQQIIDLNTRETFEANPNNKYKCLLLLDEFRTIGKIPALIKGMGYIAQYGFRMLPIVQSISQIRSVYGNDETETLLDNLAAYIVFTPKNMKVAKQISEECGQKTVNRKSKTKQLTGKSNRSVNISEQGRALILPQELMDLNRTQEIILLEYCPPIKCHRVIWYNDKIFKSRGNGRNGINWQSPNIPLLDMVNIERGTIETVRPTTLSNRAINIEDMQNISEFDLADFSCDFSDIEVPKGEITENEMNEMVDLFLNKLK